MTVRPFRRATAIGCSLLLAAALAACGTSGGEDGSSTTTTLAANDVTTTEAEVTTTTEAVDPAEVAAAEALAESVNLTIDDFAEGWDENRSGGDGEGKLAKCYTSVDFDEIKVADVDSPTFVVTDDGGANYQVVQMSTAVFDDDDDASDVVTALEDEEFASCAERSLGESSDDSSMSFEGFELVDAGDAGEEANGLVSPVTVSDAEGGSGRGEIGMFLVRTENVVTAIVVLDIGLGELEDTVRGILAEISTRQADALA